MTLRHFLIPFLIFASVVGSLSAQTAADAAAVIRAEKGPTFLQQLVEIRGERGEPNPAGWTFLFNDPRARGGIREIVVQGRMIVSERTPVRGFGGTGDLPTLPTRAKLDNLAVFRVANAAAIRRDVGFHWIDYTLRMDATSGEPIWFITLIDVLGARVGTLQVRADTLALHKGLVLEPRESVDRATTAPRSTDPAPRRGGLVGRTEEIFTGVVDTGRRGALNVAGTVEEFLFGERTIGLEEE